jgi:FSR family fosmidomycin resistance protein-like MFS transporter
MIWVVTTKILAPSWKRAGLLFLGHLLNDGYANFFAALLPLLIVRLDLSLGMAGLLGTVRILMSSVLQPSLGHLVDRTDRPLLVVLGPALTISAMGFIGQAGDFWQLILILIIAGFGTALFHPAAGSLVASLGGGKRGLAMAFFSAGGTLGSALAPLLIVTYVGALGLARTPWLLLPALAVLAWMAGSLKRNLPLQDGGNARRCARLNKLSRMFFLLWLVIVFRSMTAISFTNFLAVLITDRGASTFIGGAGLSIFRLSGVLSGFIAGGLSDRFGHKPVILGTLILSIPFFLLFLYGPTSLSLLFLGGAGLLIFASVPVGVVAAQELSPENTGLVSGLVMGLAWGMGGLILTPIGWLADIYGLIPVMTVVSFLPLLAGILVLFYHEDRMA